MNIPSFINFFIRVVYVNVYGIVDGGEDVNKFLYQFYVVAAFIVITIFITNASIMEIYKNEKIDRKDFLSEQAAKQDKIMSDDLLSILVPKFVQDMMSKGTKNIAKEYYVSILFANVCDFDEVIQCEKHKIVTHLDNLFRSFDMLCQQFGCMKIETVGTTYMAATGITECEEELPVKQKKKDMGLRLVEMALEM